MVIWHYDKETNEFHYMTIGGNERKAFKSLSAIYRYFKNKK